MNSQIISNLFGYKTEVKFTNGMSLQGGTQIANGGSIYSGGGTLATSTISASVVKALTLYACAQENISPSTLDNNGFAVKASVIKGNDKCTVEIQNGPEEFDIATYNAVTGKFMAGTLDRNTGKITKFEIGFGKRNGTVLMLAMLPILLNDVEAQNIYNQLKPTLVSDPFSFGIGNDSILAAQISDNFYFRIKNGNIKIDIPEKPSGSQIFGVPRAFSQASITTGAYAASEEDEIIGTPVIFVGNGLSSKKISTVTDIKQLAGKYILDESRSLSKREEKLVPVFKDGHKVSEHTVRICKLAKNSTKTKRVFRNFLLEGPAGTGKSVMSREVAAALHLPHTHITCNPGTEILDLIGQILPSMGTDTTSEDLENLLDLPSVDDVQFDLENSYYRLTGEKELPVGMDVMECISLLFKKQMEYIKKVKSQSLNGKDFTYVPSELVKGLKYGWVVEIQEPTLIRQAGVLAGLNDILDIESGIVQLPTGETFKRHPDCVIICTTNKSYEGCRAMNQSVLSRMQSRITVDVPSKKELTQRALFDTDSNNKLFIEECIGVMEVIQDYLSDCQLEDGVCGPRELFDWIQESVLLEDPLEAAKETICNKATDEEETREYIFREFIENVSFSSPRL